ncbi:IclR family transcriptional regulator [Gluconacetobacter tumulisoli]|uniref:IclR family transcriptional regulator n=1 Tax=Gluconacetobacter tumulisoli TaxID=1286189 RepID=A0A7W4PKD9_9PROT|nr:IclR family transcriptional regulator [Gluconacetobacter tumulisoli]MBB2200738.1 IclR family transcriptional regulator [Gluconacetobacter tumulisoli]
MRGVDRVLQLLEVLHTAREPLRIGELARRLNAPRSTTYDLVNTLLAAGILETYEEESRVFFGRTLHFYASDYMNGHRLSRLARKEVQDLCAGTGQTSQYCALTRDKFTVLHMETGNAMFKISSDIGIALPLPWTASGRLLVDHMTADEILAFVPEEDFILPNGHRIDRATFCAEVAAARRDDFFSTKGLVDDFAECLAVPVRDAAGVAVGCMCLITVRDRDPDERGRYLDQLHASGERLSRALSIKAG